MDIVSLVDQLVRHADSKISAPDIQGNKCELTFKQLHEQVTDLKQRLLSAGARKNQVVGLCLGNCIEFIVWDLALTELGMVSRVYPEAYDHSDTVQHGDQVSLWVHASDNFCPELQSQIDIRDNNPAIQLAGNAKVSPDDDVHSMVYSSGTSGYLKGLNISRAGTNQLIKDFLSSFTLGPNDKHLIFLPLSNYQQRLSVYACIQQGCHIVLTDYINLFRELPKAQATFLIAPPAVYENLYHLCINQDNPVNMLQTFIGTQMRFMITGMAPIKCKILTDFNERFKVPLLEAYGLTETGMIAWNTLTENKYGTVGKAVHAEEVVLEDGGEIFIRREFPLCKGYFQAQEEDRNSTYKEDGRIATGDIGVIDEEGFITLKGRKKNIIVTSAGIKFHPETVESQLNDMTGVDKSVVIWQETEDRLCAVIKTTEKQTPEIKQKLSTAIDQFNSYVPTHQRVSKVIFTDIEFSIGNGLLTRNMKLNRGQIERHFLSNEHPHGNENNPKTELPTTEEVI